MGWTFSYDNSRREIIARRTQGTTQADGTRWECLRHTAIGNVLWTVWEVTPGDTTKPASRFIGCDLLASGGKSMGWGYKDMCESMGPCYYTCPLSYLEMVPPRNEEWRAMVREYHAARSRKVSIGDVLIFQGLTIPEAKVIGRVKRSLIIEYGGSHFRFPPRMMTSVVDLRPAA